MNVPMEKKGASSLLAIQCNRWVLRQSISMVNGIFMHHLKPHNYTNKLEPCFLLLFSSQCELWKVSKFRIDQGHTLNFSIQIKHFTVKEFLFSCILVAGLLPKSPTTFFPFLRDTPNTWWCILRERDCDEFKATLHALPIKIGFKWFSKEQDVYIFEEIR